MPSSLTKATARPSPRLQLFYAPFSHVITGTITSTNTKTTAKRLSESTVAGLLLFPRIALALAVLVLVLVFEDGLEGRLDDDGTVLLDDGAVDVPTISASAVLTVGAVLRAALSSPPPSKHEQALLI